MPAPVSAAAAALGRRVLERREAQGLTQEALSFRCDLDFTYVGRVERGVCNLTLHSLLRLAAGLGVDPAELVTGLAPPPQRSGRGGCRAPRRRRAGRRRAA
jgi:transcriptional regulator with XRE-family HTH domain